MIFNLYDKDDIELIQQSVISRTIGITSGSFDMFHSAHVEYIDSCRRRCGHDGLLIVGVDSDRLVKERKGKDRPIIPEADRLKVITGHKSVAAGFILETAEDFGYAAQILKVKFIFKNQDYENEHVFGTEVEGSELVIVPDFERSESTTALLKKIRKIKPKDINKD